MSYEGEEIPNSDTLFMRAHVKLLKNQNFDLADPVPPNIFREHQGAMSTDWNKYSTLEQTRARGNPNLNGVIGMNVGDVINIPPLEVIHTPTVNNRAHTNIYGINQENKSRIIEIRVKLARVAQWLLKPLI